MVSTRCWPAQRVRCRRHRRARCARSVGVGVRGAQLRPSTTHSPTHPHVRPCCSLLLGQHQLGRLGRRPGRLAAHPGGHPSARQPHRPGGTGGAGGRECVRDNAGGPAAALLLGFVHLGRVRREQHRCASLRRDQHAIACHHAPRRRALGRGGRRCVGGAGHPPAETCPACPTACRLPLAGHQFACALGGDDVYCWGANSVGQLGQNTTSTTSGAVAPVHRGPGSTWVQITAGGSHRCGCAPRGGAGHAHSLHTLTCTCCTRCASAAAGWWRAAPPSAGATTRMASWAQRAWRGRATAPFLSRWQATWAASG